MRSTGSAFVGELSRDINSYIVRDNAPITKLFPIDNVSPVILEKVRSDHYNTVNKRWKRIPTAVRTHQELRTPLGHLINEILASSKISHKCRFLRADNIKLDDGAELPPPDFLLVSSGLQFVNSKVVFPYISYTTSISPIQLTCSSQQFYHRYLWIGLAVSAKRMFVCQGNRRFVVGLQFTENRVAVVMYDHHGILFSLLNYHKDPDQFIAIILNLATGSIASGFDPTIFRRDKLVICRTLAQEGVASPEYVLEGVLFQSSSLRGRGTICWKAHPVGDSSKSYIIKDAWIYENEIEGREVEGVLLAHARTCGLHTGIVQLHHFERIRHPADPNIFDTIRNNRRCDDFGWKEELSEDFDMFHHRMVMSPQGKPLDHFANRQELLYAFYDAVSAHRRLHEEAHILHRDISPGNIMINAGGENGNRGFLIDFDHALRIPSESEYAQLSRIGTERFMSRNILRGRRHTYFDDLESFFYVYLWIICGFKRPGIQKHPLPKPLSGWESTSHHLSNKQNIFEVKYEPKVSSYFTRCFRFLGFQLFKFFKTRHEDTIYPQEPSPTSAKDYDEFLGYIKEAMESLPEEELRRPPSPPAINPNLSSKSGPDGTAQTSAAASKSKDAKKRRRLRRPVSPRYEPRPRRNCANYT